MLHINHDHLFQRAFCMDCKYLYTATRYGVTYAFTEKHRVLVVTLRPGEQSKNVEVLATHFETTLRLNVFPTGRMAKTKHTKR